MSHLYLSWLTLICLLTTTLAMPLDPAIPNIGNSLIQLMDSSNKTSLKVPSCNLPSPGRQTTLDDCTQALAFQYLPVARALAVWTRETALTFKPTSGSCQISLATSHSSSQAIFKLINIANTASGIISHCAQHETSTTLGGRDFVEAEEEFTVFVKYVAPSLGVVTGYSSVSKEEFVLLAWGIRYG